MPFAQMLTVSNQMQLLADEIIEAGLMSLSGTKRTSQLRRRMSAIKRKAGIDSDDANRVFAM
jgi:hypothetical protein